jgi:hypothetical protein
MLDILLDLIDGAIDFFADNGAEIVAGTAEIIGTGLLIAGAIWVANLTVDTISRELSSRQELKNKGAKNAVVEFIRNNDSYVEIDLAVLNAANQQVGKVKVKGQNARGLKVGDKLPLNC